MRNVTQLQCSHEIVRSIFPASPRYFVHLASNSALEATVIGLRACV